MGDTGSLALGGAVGAVSILMQMPWILLIAGIIYVIEALSVLIQVVILSTRGKECLKWHLYITILNFQVGKRQR